MQQSVLSVTAHLYLLWAVCGYCLLCTCDASTDACHVQMAITTCRVQVMNQWVPAACRWSLLPVIVDDVQVMNQVMNQVMPAACRWSLLPVM